jgi:hypothetical protein
MRSKSLSTLPDLNPSEFSPEEDLFLIQKENFQLRTISFNLLLDVANFYYIGELNEWNYVAPDQKPSFAPKRLTNEGLKLPLDPNEIAIDNYAYISVRVADFIAKDGKLVPPEAKNIILTMNQTNLEFLDERGWSRFPSDQKNYVFENMQYPIMNVFKYDDIDVANKIPRSNESHFLSEDNHALFRCPISDAQSQEFWVYAWAF